MRVVLVATRVTLGSHTLQLATAQDCATHRSPAPSDASHSLLTRTLVCAGLVHAASVLLPFRYRGAPDGNLPPWREWGAVLAIDEADAEELADVATRECSRRLPSRRHGEGVRLLVGGQVAAALE